MRVPLNNPPNYRLCGTRLTGVAATQRLDNKATEIMPSPEKSFVEDGAVWGRLELSMTPGESTVYELRGNQSQVVGRASGCFCSNSRTKVRAPAAKASAGSSVGGRKRMADGCAAASSGDAGNASEPESSSTRTMPALHTSAGVE